MLHKMTRTLLIGLMLIALALPLAAQTDDDESDAESGAFCAKIKDGRLNDDPQRSCAAPVIIYLERGMRVIVMEPEMQQPRVVFRLTADEYDDIPVPEDENATIVETEDPFTGFPIVFSRLTTGEYQINAFYENGEGYIVIWDADGDHYAATYYPPNHPKYEGDDAEEDTESSDDPSAFDN